MARLKLNPDFSMKDLGQQVLLAAEAHHNGNQAARDGAEAQMVNMFADAGGFQPGNPNIVFHYDEPNVVNVVIPSIGDKVVRKENFLPEFDFDHLAAETMGFIVIFGCGK